MAISERFWNASLEELKQGYVVEENRYICLLCGTETEKGIIYPEGGMLYEAERQMQNHIRQNHGSVFHYLIRLNKKLTGLTDHQNRLMQLFYEGKSDKEIQQELDIGSTSTIRNHRFALKEKERQAKVFLVLMELLKEKDKHAPQIVNPHQTAKMVDERYNVTQAEREGILKKHFPEGTDGPLKSFPSKQKHKLVILREIVQRLTPGRFYSEKEINEILKTTYPDYALLRRYLIQYGFMDRLPDGSRYWLKTE
ncbi:DUF2087 domain-containing protein [Lihuaxuella thermophila]|uniref:DUF2087 domain-containing protein n=1 Tax=Lihuaxuella thermophila TaxID=1173111 RepID=A0A1H8AMS4_9BACL|nr:DUF2087 domain-containing protein [Lihuaxuella thermophila]SEM72062.1 hypothetical protein SAMN05444955_101250 [Lihuaxuella thermophila]